MRKDSIKYSHTLVCFDIETTHENINDIDIIYTWHWQATKREEGKEVDYYTFTGWDDFYNHLFDWCDKERLICFVHNLSYEIEAIIRNPCGHEITELFATDTHAALKFLLDGKIEFRCSYYLTNKSLAQCGEDVGLLKGDMDYKTIRHPGCTLTPQEEEYCKNDVLIMDLKIKQLEEQEGLPFWKFPLTNTSFLRNELRKIMKKEPHNYFLFKNSELIYPYFMMMRDAFQGGYTHANYMFTGKVVNGVDSYDFGSAYPFAMLVHKYPMSAFHRVDNCTMDDFNYLLNNDNIVFVCHIVLASTTGIVKCKLANTYISFSKSITPDDGTTVLDNGRIQCASQIELTCTSFDYKIIKQVYDFDLIKIKHIIWSNAGYLPDELIKTMLKYYERKQKLKNVDGEEINYMKAKNRVNSFYGMMVTNPLHDEIIINDSLDWERNAIDYDDRNIVDEMLKKFYKNRNNFLPYQWGVFVPAYTRYHLWNDIIIPNDKRIVYCDTDSAKIINRKECLPSINKYNDWAIKARRERLRDLGFKDDFPDLGVFDWETEKTGAVKFKTLGAKKYLTQDNNGKFKMTVAGLKKSAVKYIESFDDFTPGTIFSPRVSGRTISRFTTNEIKTYDNGGCWIEETTYRLSLSESYERLIAERDGLSIEEVQAKNSDLFIDKNKRVHLGVIVRESEDIDCNVILSKRNLYTLKEVRRYDEI